MSKKKLQELVASLTEEQQQSLYEQIVKPRTGDQAHGEGKRPRQYDIAIIGLSGRYPQSDNHYDFWQGLQSGKNFIEEVPASRWDHRRYYEPQVNKSFVSQKTRCRFGAFLSSHDAFDASFFQVRPEEARFMDPQARIALETTWSCIEDAGYVPSTLGGNVGIFSGVTYNEYEKSVPISTHSFMLNSRIAYFFDFQGPTVTTDAGCCSSLAAIHLACQSLMEKECETAIIIGTNIILHPDHYTSSSPMLSSGNEPYSKPFGSDDGWVPAEGVVSILLKPLNQALRDHDHVYAIIKSSHICQEGKTAWFNAFSPKQQAKLIQDNFKKSGIHPETISYVEAAANGSSFGDAIEIEGLTSAFSKFTDKKQFCPIGTVKSNVGHAEGASTLFQLTKVLLQFRSKTFVPLISLEQINPNIKIEKTPFYFQTKAETWKPPTITINGKQLALPRRATISSFGAGGNIGHLILEEHVAENRQKQNLDSYFIPLSSKTADQLLQTVKGYLLFFERCRSFDPEWESHFTLLNIMFTLCTGRVPFNERVVFIANDLETLIEKLTLFLQRANDTDIITNIITTAEPATIAAIHESSQAQAETYLKSHSWHDLAELWTRGLNISWESFFHAYPVQRIPLPTFYFERRHFSVSKPSHSELVKKDAGATSPATGSISTGVPSPETQAQGDLSIYRKAGIVETDVSLKGSVVAIVSRLLGVTAEELNIDRALDQYGLDSILFMSLFQQLQSRVDPNLSMAGLQECRTTQDIISIVQAQKMNIPAASEPQTAIFIPRVWPQYPELIRLNQGSNGRPVFWFHAAQGGVDVYQILAQKFKRPFYGVQARGWMTNRFPLHGIQAMSSYYVHIIRSVQPEGPYDLGGYSLGGAIAYEVARQLQELGQVIETIVMVDALDGSSLKKIAMSKQTATLQAVNAALISAIMRKPELISRIVQKPDLFSQMLIRGDSVNSQTEDQEYLKEMISLAKTRGLTKTETQLYEQIQHHIKVHDAYDISNFSVLRLTDPQRVVCYYFRNGSGLLFGDSAPYFSNSADSVGLVDHTDYWKEWESHLPNFRIIDVDSSSHMTMLSEPQSYERIGDVCEKLYSAEKTPSML